MTLGASESQQASRDELFSRSLFKHAAIGYFKELMPVGPWDCGQGIRRGEGQRFFFHLSPEGFLPLGPHHPAAIAAGFDPLPKEALPFPAELVRLHPWLASWCWTVARARGEGNPTLSHEHGWSFLASARDQDWSIALDEEYVFMASLTALPAPVPSPHHGWLRVFFTSDMLGPGGRLQESRRWLRENLAGGSWEGSVWRWPAGPSASEQARQLAQVGLAVGVDGTDLLLCFPTSFMPQDALAVAAMVRGLQG